MTAYDDDFRNREALMRFFQASIVDYHIGSGLTLQNRFLVSRFQLKCTIAIVFGTNSRKFIDYDYTETLKSFTQKHETNRFSAS